MPKQAQPAPVLAWHKEVADEVFENAQNNWALQTEAIIAAHDPHAETVRLLEESFTIVSNLGSTLAMMSSPDTRWESPMMTQYREHRNAIRAHLAKLKGTQ